LTGSGSTVWNASTTNFSITGSGTISLTSSSAKTFAGGSAPYTNITLNQGGSGTLTVTGNNTFKNITNTYSATGATEISFSNSTSVSQFTATGTAGKVLTLSGGATLTLTGGGTVSVDYISVTAGNTFAPGPATNGSTPYVWYLGANSSKTIAGGASTGALFQAGGAGAIKVYQITNTAPTIFTCLELGAAELLAFILHRQRRLLAAVVAAVAGTRLCQTIPQLQVHQ
jgi:hypothetical protein